MPSPAVRWALGTARSPRVHGWVNEGEIREVRGRAGEEKGELEVGLGWTL